MFLVGFIWGVTTGCVFMTFAGLWYARRLKKQREFEMKFDQEDQNQEEKESHDKI